MKHGYKKENQKYAKDQNKKKKKTVKSNQELESEMVTLSFTKFFLS